MGFHRLTPTIRVHLRTRTSGGTRRLWKVLAAPLFHRHPVPAR